MESIFDGLIEFKTKEELKKFVDTVDKDHAIKVVEMALEYSHKSGIFTIEEAHVIYTCLTKLKSND